MPKFISRKDALTKNARYEDGSLIEVAKEVALVKAAPVDDMGQGKEFISAFANFLQAMAEKIDAVPVPKKEVIEPVATVPEVINEPLDEVAADLGYEFEVTEFDDHKQVKTIVATDSAQLNNVYSIDRRDSKGNARHYLHNNSVRVDADYAFTVEERSEDGRIYRIGVNGEYELIISKRDSKGRLSKFNMVDGPTFSILERDDSGNVLNFAVA